jgi:fucose permease
MNFFLVSKEPGVLYFLLVVLAALAIGTLLITRLSRLFYQKKNYLELPTLKRLVIATIALIISGSLSALGVFYLGSFLSAIQS